MPSLKALPDRIVLRFPAPVEMRGTIIIPATSQVRPEFGEIHDIGEPLSQETRATALRLRELKDAGSKIAVTYSSGVGYLTESQKNALDMKEWGWLAEYRTYRIAELAAYLEP